jgi:hypothetical protein
MFPKKRTNVLQYFLMRIVYLYVLYNLVARKGMYNWQALHKTDTEKTLLLPEKHNNLLCLVLKSLAHDRWFSPASFTTKTGRRDIAESGIKHNKSNL